MQLYDRFQSLPIVKQILDQHRRAEHRRRKDLVAEIARLRTEKERDLTSLSAVVAAKRAAVEAAVEAAEKALREARQDLARAEVAYSGHDSSLSGAIRRLEHELVDTADPRIIEFDAELGRIHGEVRMRGVSIHAYISQDVVTGKKTRTEESDGARVSRRLERIRAAREEARALRFAAYDDIEAEISRIREQLREEA